jgi:hypothetical protein
MIFDRSHISSCWPRRWTRLQSQKKQFSRASSLFYSKSRVLTRHALFRVTSCRDFISRRVDIAARMSLSSSHGNQWPSEARALIAAKASFTRT